MSTETLERAMGVARQVLSRVTPAQLDQPTPCASWDVRQLINHLVGGSFMFATTTTGAEPGPEATADHAAGDFTAAYDDGTARAIAAFSRPGVLDETLHLPFGDFPGAAWMNIATMDTFTHAWDLAKATGQDADLDPELAAQLLDTARASIPASFRGDEGAPFAAERDAGPGATNADRLAAFLGRTTA